MSQNPDTSIIQPSRNHQSHSQNLYESQNLKKFRIPAQKQTLQKSNAGCSSIQDLEEKGINECQQSKQQDQKKEKTQNKWTSQQIRLIFESYEQYGTKWSLILKYFPSKTQNDIKNRFYGFFKKVLRHLFKQLGSISGKSVKLISSNQIIKIYQGYHKYRKFRGFLKTCFEQLDYDVHRHTIRKFVAKNQLKIKELYELIVGTKLQFKAQEEKIKEKTSLPESIHQNSFVMNQVKTESISPYNSLIFPFNCETLYYQQYKNYFDFLAVMMVNNRLNYSYY